jgi:hypothetical protein
VNEETAQELERGGWDFLQGEEKATAKALTQRSLRAQSAQRKARKGKLGWTFKAGRKVRTKN